MALKYLTPGPVQIPKSVIESIGRQPQFHRGDEFREVFKEVINKLMSIYDSRPIIIPGTGTLSVDVAVYNYLDPNDKAVVIVNGEFGERFAESLASRGCIVRKVEWEYGDVPPPDVIEDVVRREGNVKAVAVVHNESSTGTTNRYIEKYQEVAEAYGAVLLIDSVSLFPVEVPKRGVDVIATASHKAFISPPGASILYISKEPRAKAPIPPSMDLRKFIKFMERFETPYTPPINVIYGLNSALDYILKLGIEHYRRIHVDRAEFLYNRIRLKAVARNEFRSYTVTAFYTPKAREVVTALRSYGYVITAGMGKLRDSIIRIGVMGDVSLDDLSTVAEVVNRYVD